MIDPYVVAWIGAVIGLACGLFGPVAMFEGHPKIGYVLFVLAIAGVLTGITGFGYAAYNPVFPSAADPACHWANNSTVSVLICERCQL